ncbi:reverse transcriptase domain-containing protein [Tanacetum coccineum]
MQRKGSNPKITEAIKKEVNKASRCPLELPQHKSDIPWVSPTHDSSFGKETPFVFSDECKQAFNDLRKKLIESPILVVPNWDYDFEIMCDASDFALGAVLGFPGLWRNSCSKLWKNKAMPTISIDGLQSSLHKVGNLLSLSLIELKSILLA